MGDILILIIAISLFWIGWQLTRIADLLGGFVANYKESAENKGNRGAIPTAQ
jgi:hypothetical protein